MTAGQYLGNVATNLKTFLAADFHMKSGMKCLFDSFYRSITEGTPAPIPYREILLTARIMDNIFAQLDAQKGSNGPPIPEARVAALASHDNP